MVLFIPLQSAAITIITATYNSALYLEQCLRSLHVACCKINHVNVAHLIIDGCSDDNTIEIIKTESVTSTVVVQQTKGLYNALNEAIALVQSPYLMYLHSDDELAPNFLLEMVNAIAKSSSKSKPLFYGTIDFIDEQGHILFSRRPPVYFKAIQNHTNLIFHPNGMYPTHLEKSHPYRTDVGLVADHDHISIIAQKTALIRVPQAKYRFRMSTESSTMQKLASASSPSAKVLPRIYLHAFETHLFSRFIKKIFYKQSYWSSMSL